MLHIYFNLNLFDRCRLPFSPFNNSKVSGLDRTGVINDPLGHPLVPAGSDFHLIFKFWDGRTTCVKMMTTTSMTLVGHVDKKFAN